MAEEFAFQQSLGNGGTVQSQERRVGPAAVVKQGPCNQLFAGAACAGDEHGLVAGSESANRLVNLLHGRGLPDDALGVFTRESIHFREELLVAPPGSWAFFRLP